MTDATAAFYDDPRFDGRVVSFGDWDRVAKLIRSIAGTAVFGAGVVAAAGLLVVIVTLAAAWIVNTSHSADSLIHARAPTGPGTLALATYEPALAGAPAVTFADRWARATASMQARAVPLTTPQTQVAQLAPAEPPAAAPVRALPLPRAYPAQREIGLSTVRLTGDRVASQVAAVAPPPSPEKRAAPLQEAHNKPMALPTPDSRTAVYDIAAHTVYLPNGERLEAHSGLGGKLDDPRYVKVRMHGPTPPNVYQLALREEPFHGVRAIRLNPVDDDKMFGRAGMLAHTYMLGPNGQSNGCVSFKDYHKFLQAYLNGAVERLVVVAHLDTMPSRVVYERRGRAERYASNN